MHPILLQVGSFSIKTYGFLIAVGFLAGISLALRDAKRLGYDQQIILDIAFYIIIGAIVGSRIFYVLINFSHYLQHPLAVFKIWQGGLVFFGGFILAVVLALWIIRKNRLPVWRTLDIFAPSLAVGVFFGRLGCFSAGCCYGKPCDLPWAVTFTNPHSLAQLHTPLHPTQLYASCGALITFCILYLTRKKKFFDGQLTLMWVILYSGFRLIEETYRGDFRGDLVFGMYTVSQVISVVLIAAAVICFPVLKKRGRTDDRTPC